MLLAYFGPETVLPLTSLLAGAAGVFLMFGRAILKVVRRVFRVLRPGKAAVVPAAQSAGKRLRTDGPNSATHTTPAPSSSAASHVRT